MNRRWLIFGSIAFFLFEGIGYSLPPNSEEMNEKSQIVASRFCLDGAFFQAKYGINVLENHEPVQKNAVGDRPLRISNQSFEKGLFCHANSHLQILLDRPAKKLSGVAGVDVNHDGGGSVNFSVEVTGEKRFESKVLHGGESGVPFEVSLDSATEFELFASDGGDGIACDQADWADLLVEFEDGTTQYVSDMPLLSSKEWLNEPAYPFSFSFGEKSSREFLSDWNLEVSDRAVKDAVLEKTLLFTNPEKTFQVRCVATIYEDFPVVDWVLYFKNIGAENSPILENIQPLDLNFSPTADSFLLHYFNGDACGIDAYLPHEKRLEPKSSIDFSADEGRPTNGQFPYYNLEIEKGKGVILVLGWPGQWATHFDFEAEDRLHVTGGQELARFTLFPGEEVRTPNVILQPWQRDTWINAQNVWRAWMIRHIVPRQNGQLVDHHLAACSSHQFGEMVRATAQDQNLFIDRYLEEGLNLDYWWMDAGWYPCEGNWMKTGTWKADPVRFPNGLREVTDHGRSQGVQSIVWFEPECANPDSWLGKNHPDWLYENTYTDRNLVHFDKPEVLDWMVQHICGMIEQEGIDLYRQDYGIPILPNWRQNEPEDRLGMQEIKHVENYLAFWDALLERFPQLRIDSCASGGRRNDIETMKRAVPLLRSDYIFEPVGQQIHTYGLSFWIPFHGTGLNSLDDYGIRSCLAPYQNMCFDVRDKNLNYEILRKNLKIWEDVLAPNFSGDYYPLTECDDHRDRWIGWQFDSPEKGTGFVMMFRRSESRMIKSEFSLCGLDIDATYQVTNVDSGQTFTKTGQELVEAGIAIEIPYRQGVVTYHYTKISQ